MRASSEVSAILQALHIRALLSRSIGEMKFDSSSCMLKPVYFAFFKTMLEFFLQTTHFVKSRVHSPRRTSKIIAMIVLRRAILMKANPVVNLHTHRLFSGRACSCKKDPCSQEDYPCKGEGTPPIRESKVKKRKRGDGREKCFITFFLQWAERLRFHALRIHI